MKSVEFWTKLRSFGVWAMVLGLIALIVGSTSAGFLITLDWVGTWRDQHLMIIALLPIAGFFVAWMYHKWGVSAEGGNNLIIQEIQEPQKPIPMIMAPLIYVGTLITHLFGGSAGREGTAVQMAAALTDPISKWGIFTSNQRVLLLQCAVAAGFGAVFGTPLAGAVFALEWALVGRLKYTHFPAVLLAAILADRIALLCGAHHTDYPIYEVPFLSFSGIGISAIAGVLFGLTATFFGVAMREASHKMKEWIAYPPFRAAAGGAIVALMVWLLGTTRYVGLGIPAMVEAFQVPAMGYEFALKLLLTVITLASGFKGGEVTPLFFIGATLGSALSMVLPLPTALLAGMGFVAVFAGATRTPLACILMAVEMFGADAALYAAIAVVVAYWSSTTKGIYNSQKTLEDSGNH
jgi:H+/Cl- antiporter ClcA